MDRLFRPARIAIIGASARRTDAGGNQVIRNLQNSRYDGVIDVVNPSGGIIEGLPVTTSVDQLTPPDVAFLALPAPAVPDALAQLEAIGCGAAVVPSSGLTHAQEEQVRQIAARSSMVIHGPNCMGLINANDGIPLWLDEGNLVDVPVGNIALVAQSGSAAIFVARSAAPSGFSKIVSTGNEMALGAADYVSWLADDPDTAVIGLVLESIQDPAHFRSAVGKSRASGKPIVVLKVGRTDSGARATTAHTGAVVAPSAAYEALFEELDVPTVADYDELATSLQLLAQLPGRSLRGGRLGVITISGGQAAMAADLAEDLGVELPTLGADLARSIAEVLPDIPINNPLDAGGTLVGAETSYEEALDLMASAPDLDGVMVLLDCQSTLNDIEIAYEDEYIVAARKVAGRSDRLPVFVASSSSVNIHERTRTLLDDQLPVLRGVRNALVATRVATRNTRHPVRPDRPADLPTPVDVEDLRSSIAAVDVISPDLTRDLLRSYGISFVARANAADVDAAVTAAEEIGYPVVLKIDSPDIAHRSDVGGVVVGISDAAELASAAAQVFETVSASCPTATLTGFEVQEQVRDAVEAFAGYVSDPILGPTVAVGSGGVLVELIDDAAVATCPTGPDKAAGLIADTKLGKVLGGYRALVLPTDTAPLADLVSRLSWLAADLGDQLTEADLNPVLVEPGSGRVRIVDALLVKKEQQ
ncbi:MAG: acetate--CoA ligase family protein [Nocardioides sp.]